MRDAIALAMGVAVVVLNVGSPLSLTATMLLLGISVAAPGIANLQEE